MNIIEIGKFISEGKKVRRKSWRSDEYYHLVDGRLRSEMMSGAYFSFESIQANDWEVVEEKSPKEKAWEEVKNSRVFFGEDSLKVGQDFFNEVWSKAEKHFNKQSTV